MPITQLNTKNIKNKSIINEDIADNANIAISKINNLSTQLNNINIALLTKEPLLPNKNNNAGKFLQTDGENLLWSVTGSSTSGDVNPIIFNTEATLLKTNWVLDGDLYTYTYTNPNIYAYSYVEVIPNNNSIYDILYSEIYPKVQINDSNIVIYAKKIPSNNINVFINVITKAPNPINIIRQTNNLTIDGLLGTYFIINITSPTTYAFDLDNIVPGIFYYILIKNNSGVNIAINLPNINTIRAIDNIILVNTKIKEFSILSDGSDYIFQVSEELYK